VFLGCTNKELSNEYFFSNDTNDWYIIINGCVDGRDFIEGDKRKFVFPENGIILADIENFNITKNDAFFIQGESFNPNSKDKESYKLCYYTSSINSGYNAEYLSKEYDIPPLGENINANQNFDFYFFKIGKSCNDNTKSTDELFDDLFLHLLKNKIIATK
jgi:hypothetical protein